MRKILILFFLFSQAVYAKVGVQSNHPQELLSHYPYGLLTGDYGILNLDDLKINACEAIPAPFSEKKPYAVYPYWQCFEAKSAKLICEGRQYDGESQTRVSWLIVSARLNGELHEYMARRNMSVHACALYKKRWLQLTKGQKYVCVSGSMWSNKKDEKGNRVWTWIFGRYKTKKGCDSYFEGECHLQSVLAQQGPCEN